MRRLATALALLLVACGVGPAAAERLVVSLSNHRVAVTSNFVGDELVLFGTIEPDQATGQLRPPYDLVVTVTGPQQTLRTRRKQRVLGIWVNVDSREFVSVPSYLAVLSNRPVAEIADQETLRKLQRQQGLYRESSTALTFLTPTVFRTAIAMPAAVPTGTYAVEVELFSQGKLVARTNSALEVIKTGFEQYVADAARDYGLLYGMATALMALLIGWFASVVFRRD